MAQPENPFDKTQEEDPFASARGRLKKASSSFEKVAIDENLDKLVLFWPTEFHSKVQTKFTKPGEEGADAVTVDAVVLEDDGEHQVLNGVMVFPKVLVGQLKSEIGSTEPVFGRLTKVPSQKGHPAWSIDSENLTDKDTDKAIEYLDQKEKDAKEAARAKLKGAAKS